MAKTFVVARNPDPESTLPYLLQLPVSGRQLILKSRETWPRTNKIYCHRAEDWPDSAQIVEEVPIRSCVRRGVAIDLVLDRARENRSQFVFTTIQGGREGIFWQSPRTTRKARPGIRVPTRRAGGLTDLVILVDTRERYPYRFAKQQTETRRHALPSGDYGVESEGEIVATVERKSVADLAGRLVDGSFTYAMAELATLPRSAVVVEDRYSDLFKNEHVAAGFLADLLAAVQVRYPSVPIVFCETRPLAEEWTYRFLAAALKFAEAEADAQAEGGSVGAGWGGPKGPDAGKTTAASRASAATEGAGDRTGVQGAESDPAEVPPAAKARAKRGARVPR
ncbi:MAG TPA: ERCC4 domain-containing protein [Acidimicrobiia bacterium]